MHENLDGKKDGNTVLPMKTISFKVTDDEVRRIRLRAKEQRISVSEYLRRSATGAAQSGAPKHVQCPRTGAKIFGPLPGAEPLTNARVRELLADFP